MASSGPSGLHRGRRWLIAFVVVTLAALLASLLELGNSLGGDDTEPPPPSVVDWRYVPSLRGRILDRNGKPLADNRPAFDVYVVPRRFTTEVRARLIELLELREDEVARVDGRLAYQRDDPQGRAILVLEDQGRERADLVAGARLDLGGAVEVHVNPHRRYPHGELAAHIIGYANHPGLAEQVELEHEGYDAAELIGRRGVEQALERSLHGTRGIERFILDDKPRRELPVPGHDVVLTIDLELQRLAANAVSGYQAAAVAVVDLNTGRILALVSTPSFDPDVMTDPLSTSEREGLEADPRHPLLDRTLEQDYPPGSTWKLVTAVAGLQSGMASPSDELTCSGKRTVGKYVLLDMHAHGVVDFLEAMQVSCNVYFWQVGERAGIDSMAQVARDLGFGESTTLGINGDQSGRVPDSGTYGGTDSLLPTLKTAIGGGDVRLTVIQLAMAYAAVANGGRLYAPQVVRRVQAASGQVLQEREPILRRNVDVPAATLEVIREGMRRAVNARDGTAFAARNGAVKMSGKTGTAPVIGGYSKIAHALFAGWAPSDRPQIAFAVLIEHGGVGGVVAAPVARTIVDGYFTRVLPRERKRAR